MKKRDPVEEKRARLNEVREHGATPESIELLKKGLADRVQVVVARAAELASELKLAELASDLVKAFERLLIDPSKRDKGCLGKTAVLQALVRIEHQDPEIFLKAIRHVQREPVWGGTEDTAAELRGIAAAGLVQCGHPDELNELVDLLADEEKLARMGAARALAQLGRLEGASVLRLKIHVGDEAPDVMGECFSAYLTLASPAEGCAFVGRFLGDSDAAVAEAAAMALGESRRAPAVDVLKVAFDRTLDRSLRRVLLVALAMTRSDAANDFLVSLIASGPPVLSRAAHAAIEPFLYNEDLRERVGKAVAERGTD